MPDDLKPIGGMILPGLFGDITTPPKVPSRKASSRPQTITAIKQRLIDAAASTEAQEILYQHTIFCQTGMPYRNPGDEVRRWERSNGQASLLINAGEIMNPRTGRWVETGLPFGPKPRLILAHINTEALLTGKPEIDADRSLTAFVSRNLGLTTDGRTIRVIKDQLTRLSACNMRIGAVVDGEADVLKTDVVKHFRLWPEKDERQRVLWPRTIRLDLEYFESLQRHAVPLDEGHLAALSHSALAIDVYSWLAQRLHRVQTGRPAFIPWVPLHQQFGADYDRIRAFRSVFKVALKQVQTVYRGARIGCDARGMTLWHSPLPVPPRFFRTFLGKPRDDGKTR